MKKLILVLILISIIFSRTFALNFTASAFDEFSADKMSFMQNSPSSDDEENDEFAKVFLLLILLAACGVAVSYYWLNTVDFYDYPYQEVDNGKANNYAIRGETEKGSFILSDPGYNDNRFAIDTSFVYLKDFGYGNETRLEGLLFPYYGPCFENLVLFSQKKSDSFFGPSSYKGNLKLGGQISLLQSDMLTVNFLLQYATWYGKGVADMKNGIAWGICMRSYPKKPFSLEWHFDFQYYSDLVVFESNLQAGILKGPNEVFAAWKTMNINHDDFGHARTDGVTLGVRHHFSF